MGDAKASGAKGIVAIDITRAVNPRFIIPTAGRPEDVRTGLLKVLQDFIRANRRLWGQHKPGTLGLLTRVTARIQTEDAMFTHAQQYSLTPLQNISESEDAVVKEFSAVLAAAAAADGQRPSAKTNVFKAYL